MSAERDHVLAHVAQAIWEHTGAEGECEADGAYEPCENCLRSIFLPAAEAVLALDALTAYFGSSTEDGGS